jgi:hypothetical protein
VDVYNVMNGSTATFIRNTYSAPDAVTATPWLQPTQVQDGRFWKFSVQYDF